MDIQEQVIKTNCLPWGAPSFWSGRGVPLFCLSTSHNLTRLVLFLSLLPALPGPRGRSPGQGPLHPRPAKAELAPSPQRPDEWEQEGLLQKCRNKEGELVQRGAEHWGGGFHTTSPLHQAARWTPCLLGTHILPPCSGLGSGAIAQGTLFSPLPMPGGAPTCP